MKINIEPLLPNHYLAVRRIYEEGIATGIATFETKSIEWAAWDEKYLPQCRFVAMLEGEVVGWVALTPYSKREVYRGVGETAIYVSATCRGMGVGAALLRHQIIAAKEGGFWTLQAVTFAENKASIRLHQQAGFRLIGIRERIAQLNGIWHDNALLELRM